MATTTRVLTASVNGTVYTTNANGALEAIDTCHSGATAPTNEVANGKLWLDTTTTPGILKMYNNAAWEVIGGSTSSPTFAGLTTTGAISVNRTAGYGSVEVGGPSGALIDLKSPASDDYDARIIYTGGTDLQITTLAAGEPILLRQGGSTKLETSSTGVDVTGNLTATGNVSGVNGTFTGDVNIGDDLWVTGPNPTIYLTDDDVASEWSQISNSSGNTFYTSRNGAANGQHIFQQNAGGVTTEAMRINAYGRVGLGITGPTEKLHVVGNALISGTIKSSGSIVSGNGGGGVALTTNDGQGNANVTFNHADGIPDQFGNGGRIIVNTDSTSAPTMIFELGSANTSGVAYNTTEYMRVNTNGISVNGTATATSFAGDGSALTGIGTATAGLATGSVGSYAYLLHTSVDTTIRSGNTKAGSSLRYSGQSSESKTTSSGYSVGHGNGCATPSGTWRCMGDRGTSSGYSYFATLWLRIS